MRAWVLKQWESCSRFIPSSDEQHCMHWLVPVKCVKKMLNFSHTVSSSGPICHLIRCYIETEKSFESFPKNNAPHFNSIQYSSASFQPTAAETQRAAEIQRSWLCQTVYTQHEWVWMTALNGPLQVCIRKWNSSYIASWDVDVCTYIFIITILKCLNIIKINYNN